MRLHVRQQIDTNALRCLAVVSYVGEVDANTKRQFFWTKKVMSRLCLLKEAQYRTVWHYSHSEAQWYKSEQLAYRTKRRLQLRKRYAAYDP